jgi:hypothetical protein
VGARLAQGVGYERERFGGPDRPDGPWPLTRAEVESFAGDGLTLRRLEDFRDADAHRWRAEFRRVPAG